MSFPSSEVKNKNYYKFKREIREGELLNIPENTIKGLIRHYVGGTIKMSAEEELFGKINGGAKKSKTKFNDAFALPETIVTSVCHSTAIDPMHQSVKSGNIGYFYYQKRKNYCKVVKFQCRLC